MISYASDTLGAWRREGWKPDIQYFRCTGCGAIVPESQWAVSDVEKKKCKECREVKDIVCPGTAQNQVPKRKVCFGRNAKYGTETQAQGRHKNPTRTNATGRRGPDADSDPALTSRRRNARFT